MNLKSYTRGIGAGLIVAALVLGIGSKTEKMTDAQIVERAKEMGLIEAQMLTQISNESQVPEAGSSSSETSTSETMPEFKEKDEVTVEPILPETETSVSEETSEVSTGISEEIETQTSVETSVEETTSAETSVTTEPETKEEEAGFESDEAGVMITVVKGDSSVTVARRLFEAKLVESAVEFDKYLCSNGDDRRICVGTYMIRYGADFEKIAKIITRK